MAQYGVSVSTKQVQEVATNGNTVLSKVVATTSESKRVIDTEVTRIVGRTFLNTVAVKNVQANQSFVQGSLNPDITFPSKYVVSVERRLSNAVPQKTFSKQVTANIQGYVGESIYYASAQFGNQVDAQESLRWNATTGSYAGNGSISNANTILFGSYFYQTSNNSNTSFQGGNNYNRAIIQGVYPRPNKSITTNQKFVYYVSDRGMYVDVVNGILYANVRGRQTYSGSDDIGLLVGWNDGVFITGNTTYLDISTSNVGYQVNDPLTLYGSDRTKSTSQVVTIIDAASNSAVLYRGTQTVEISDLRLMPAFKHNSVTKVVAKAAADVVTYPFTRTNKIVDVGYRVPTASFINVTTAPTISTSGILNTNVHGSYTFSNYVREAAGSGSEYNYYITPTPNQYNVHIVIPNSKRDTITKRVATSGGGGSKYNWS